MIVILNDYEVENSGRLTLQADFVFALVHDGEPNSKMAFEVIKSRENNKGDRIDMEQLSELFLAESIFQRDRASLLSDTDKDTRKSSF